MESATAGASKTALWPSRWWATPAQRPPSFVHRVRLPRSPYVCRARCSLLLLVADAV